MKSEDFTNMLSNANSDAEVFILDTNSNKPISNILYIKDMKYPGQAFITLIDKLDQEGTTVKQMIKTIEELNDPLAEIVIDYSYKQGYKEIDRIVISEKEVYLFATNKKEL